MSELIYINARFLTQNISGVQKFGIEIAKRIQGKVNCVFLSPNKIIHKKLAEELNVVVIGKYSSHVWEQIELPLYLRKIGSPLLFNYNGMGPVFYKNKIITIHDLSFIVNPGWFSFRYAIFYKFFTSISAKRSKKIVTVSEFSKREIIDNLKIVPSKIEKISNAVYFEKTELRKNLIDSPYILTVSSLEPRKNLKRLLSAYKDLKLDGVKLVIVGAPNKIFREEETTEYFDDVIYWGYAEENELISLYQNALLFVFPSLYEGFGIPPLEAMYCGCPVTSSNADSLKEVCDEAAFYFDPLDTNSIKKAMIYLINNDEERSKLIEKGYKNAERFSWDKSVEKLLTIISKL